MRLLLIDIDSLRPDHLGCYGYGRNASPNIDEIARQGTRFDNCFVSDSPCGPSRTGFASGICATRNGVIGHSGEAFRLRVPIKPLSMPRKLHQAGVKTATISSFADRHEAWWFLAGFREAITHTLKGGQENAPEVNAAAIPWLRENAAQDDWMLHVQYWDPHTPYTSPSKWVKRFLDDPLPDCPTEEEFEENLLLGVPHSPSFLYYGDVDESVYPRERIPVRLHWGGIGYEFPSPHVAKPRLDSFDDYRHWISAYDGGIAYADHHVGQLLEVLAEKGVLHETVVMVTADHGEHQGEFGIYGEHCSVFDATQKVPLIIKAPGIFEPSESRAELVSHLDIVPTIAEIFGVECAPEWDGRSLLDLTGGRGAPWRNHLVNTHGLWSAQRGVRTEKWSYVHTYHPGHFLQFEETSLFDVDSDRHQRHNLAASSSSVVQSMESLLKQWLSETLLRMPNGGIDPLDITIEKKPYAVDVNHWYRVLMERGFVEFARKHARVAGIGPTE